MELNKNKNSPIIGYVWVNNQAKVNEDNQIPCQEKGHGLNAVIHNANLNPSINHVIYLDRLNDGNITYDTSIEIPQNVRFDSVDNLFSNCTKLMTNKEDKAAITKLHEIYNAEMKFGKAAYAGNVVKMLSLYKNGACSDIGITFKVLSNPLPQNTRAQPPVFFHFSDKDCKDYIVEGIKSFISAYQKDLEKTKEQLQQLQENNINSKELINPLKADNNKYITPETFVKNATEIMNLAIKKGLYRSSNEELKQEELGDIYKIQDDAFACFVGKMDSIISRIIQEDKDFKLIHKTSHLQHKSEYNDSQQYQLLQQKQQANINQTQSQQPIEKNKQYNDGLETGQLQKKPKEQIILKTEKNKNIIKLDEITKPTLFTKKRNKSMIINPTQAKNRNQESCTIF